MFSLKVVSNLTGNRGGRVERKSILGKFPVFPRKIAEKTSLKERFSKNKEIICYNFNNKGHTAPNCPKHHTEQGLQQGLFQCHLSWHL